MCFPCLGPSVPNHQDVRLMEWWMGCYWLVFHDRQSYPPWIGKRIWSKHVNFYQIPAWAEKMLRQTVGHLCSVSVNGFRYLHSPLDKATSSQFQVRSVSTFSGVFNKTFRCFSWVWVKMNGPQEWLVECWKLLILWVGVRWNPIFGRQPWCKTYGASQSFMKWEGQYGRIQREWGSMFSNCIYNILQQHVTTYNVSNCLRSMKWDPESPECERMVRVRRCEWSSCFGDENVVLPSVRLMRWAWVRIWFLKMCRLFLVF